MGRTNLKSSHLSRFLSPPSFVKTLELENGDEEPDPMVDDRARGGVVRVEHRCPASEQVLAEQLRVQVPGLPDPLPHDRLLLAQLRRHCVHEGGAHAEHQVHRTAPQDRRPQRRFLLLRRLRERVVGVPSGVV